jgi:hypothetical protein
MQKQRDETQPYPLTGVIKMNRTLSAVLLATAALSTSAFADARYDSGPVMSPATTSAMAPASQAASVSRASVQAELTRADRSGEIAYSHTAYPALQHMMPVATSLSRADVKAELARASAAHEVQGDRHS